MLTAAVVAPGWAQTVDPIEVQGEVFVGSEMEEYLRFLQSIGKGSPYPWSIRALSPGEVERVLPADTAHPWGMRYSMRPDSAPGFRLQALRPRAEVIYNSRFPWGVNDGSVWAGRGVTTALQAGFAARYGPLSLVFAPEIFWAQNADFPLAPNGQTGRLGYADPLLPLRIDRPQRFGEDPYLRLDPGQSTLRLDLPLVTAGVSTANQHWGPATEHPIVLGNNAPGFLHAFVGTSAPVNVGIGRIHGRMVWGRLEQSDYSSATSPDSSLRFMSGLVAMFLPRGVPGLEIGATRFFHSPWSSDGIAAGYFLKPLESFFKSTITEQSQTDGDVDNQLASVFARWVFPGSGFEVYGEYGREDHNWDLRDFLLEPDQASAYMLGLRKLWRPSPSRFTTLRGEVLNAQVSHLVRARPQSPFYNHGAHGHTHRGQILGSSAAFGGAGSVLAVDSYHPGGRWTLSWKRSISDPGLRVEPPELDVLNTLGVEALVFRGGWEMTFGLAGMYNSNRNYASDEMNLNATLGVRARLW